MVQLDQRKSARVPIVSHRRSSCGSAPAAASLTARALHIIRNAMARVHEAISDRRRQKQGMDELSQLDEATLNQMGLPRGVMSKVELTQRHVKPFTIHY